MRHLYVCTAREKCPYRAYPRPCHRFYTRHSTYNTMCVLSLRQHLVVPLDGSATGTGGCVQIRFRTHAHSRSFHSSQHSAVPQMSTHCPSCLLYIMQQRYRLCLGLSHLSGLMSNISLLLRIPSQASQWSQHPHGVQQATAIPRVPPSQGGYQPCRYLLEIVAFISPLR